jgi:hypothetical protein
MSLFYWGDMIMEFNNIHQHTFLTEKSAALLKQLNIPSHIVKQHSTSNYTDILLREYQSLIELLTHLDTTTFQHINIEVNDIIEKLTAWFHQTPENNTLEIYWTLRNLKQKVRLHIQRTQKTQIRMRSKVLS